MEVSTIHFCYRQDCGGTLGVDTCFLWSLGWLVFWSYKHWVVALKRGLRRAQNLVSSKANLLGFKSPGGSILIHSRSSRMNCNLVGAGIEVANGLRCEKVTIVDSCRFDVTLVDLQDFAA